jgi:transposase
MSLALSPRLVVAISSTILSYAFVLPAREVHEVRARHGGRRGLVEAKAEVRVGRHRAAVGPRIAESYSPLLKRSFMSVGIAQRHVDALAA